MNHDEEEMHLPPKYRVRLFLSADLAGSTAYKSDKANKNWASVFKKFYSNFLELFCSNYQNECAGHPEKCDQFAGKLPKLWKTVGDEVIFVNRVDSFMQVFTYVEAFIKTLKEYKGVLRDSKINMDVKGNGWIGSFPHPNQTFKLTVSSDEQVFDLPNEKLEQAADEIPSQYDFLGSGIDYGFRIGKNSKSDFFTVSPALASILCFANITNDQIIPFSFALKFRGMNCLKGVLDGNDYPIFGLNTEFNSSRNTLSNLQAKLSGDIEPSSEELSTYLEEFIKFHEIEDPTLKIQENDRKKENPYYYKEFLNTWQEDYQGWKRSKEEVEASALDDDEPLNEDRLNQIVEELAAAMMSPKFKGT